MQKTLLAIAVSATLTTACGSSGSGDPAPLDNAGTVSPAVPTTPAASPNPLDPTAPDTTSGDPATGVPDAPRADVPTANDVPSAGGGPTTPTDPPAALPVAGDESGAPVDAGPDAAPTAAAPTITADNYVALLSEVFATFTGNNYAAKVFPIAKAYPLTITSAEAYEIHTSGTPLELACSNGGVASYYAVSWTFADCQTGNRVIDGSVGIDPGDTSGALFVFDSPDGITSESQEGSVDFAGKMAYLPRGSRGSADPAWGAQIERLVSSEGTDALSLSDLDTDYLYGFDSAMYLSGKFTLNAPVTGGRDVTVEVTEALTSSFDPEIPPGERYDFDFDTVVFKAGTLRLTAADGNTLELDAANGDEATARVTITMGGTREEYVADWSLWLPDLRFARDGRLVDIEDF